MSRYLGSVCKICRREKEKLVLKGERCMTKCAFDRKRGKNPPGQHGGARARKQSDYARHLREKQKARSVYGLTEEQFRHYFRRAEKMKGLTGDNLLTLLELRLDNVVYRIGLAPTRRMARQIVSHGNVMVNDRRVNLPGYEVSPGDKITLKEKLRENPLVKRSMEAVARIPSWLSLDKQNTAGSIVNVPSPDEFSHPIESQLIVELYSK